MAMKGFGYTQVNYASQRLDGFQRWNIALTRLLMMAMDRGFLEQTTQGVTILRTISTVVQKPMDGQ